MKKSEEGLEGLTKPRESSDKRPAESGGSKKPAEKKTAASHHPKGHKIRRIVTEQLHDGTFHHEQHYEDDRGIPSNVQTASSATADDAGSHVAEQFGGGQPSEPMQDDQGAPQSPALGAEMGGQ